MIQSDIDLVKFHESCTLIAKPDAKGKWEIGWGHDIAPPDDSLPAICTQDQADEWIDSDIALARDRAASAIGEAWWEVLDEVRKAVLVDMAYELGGTGLQEFTLMLGAIRAQNWDLAQKYGLNSLWAREVPTRAKMDMQMMLSGEWPT